MVYRRPARPTYVFHAKTRKGFRQFSTRTSDKRLADRIEAMWNVLADEHRAWDCLELVLTKQVKIGELFDLWLESGRKIADLRRRLNDIDLEPLVGEFLTIYGKLRERTDTVDHVRAHLRWLMPEGQRFPRSQGNADWLTSRLYQYEGKPGTLRKVHSSWSVFFTYLTKTKKAFDRNPMETVERPPVTKPPIRFYELDTVERIVGWQPTAERRALFALLYGTGIEISVALGLTRADVHEARKEVRAAGTKTHSRDRIVRVADWAWPTFWGHAEAILPAAKLFPAVPSRHTASDWHAATVKGLDLSEQYPMYNARHHWAVRQLRGGAPIRLVQEQLGHSSPNLTLSTYGQFKATGQDRDKWEAAATQYERDRRESSPSSAASGANMTNLKLSNSRGET